MENNPEPRAEHIGDEFVMTVVTFSVLAISPSLVDVTREATLRIRINSGDGMEREYHCRRKAGSRLVRRHLTTAYTYEDV